MKYSRKSMLIGLTALATGALCLQAELAKWVENVEGSGRLEAVFFRNVLLPSGQVPIRRPPKETRAALSRLISAAPNDAELYTLRALEAEQQLDFSAAESDWKKCIDVAADKGAARLALADYYHRRHQPQQEFDALTFAAREFAPESERLLPDTQQRPWKTYQRLIQLIDDQRLDPTLGIAQYGAWIQRFPKEPSAYQGWFNYSLAHRQFAEADQAIALYQRTFPGDTEFPVAARAETAAKRGATAEALAIFESSYRPQWPESLVKRQFDLLRSTNSMRTYLDRARSGVAANPASIDPASRLFHYWQQQGNTAAAERALAEFRQRKQARQSAWAADELLTMARLAESVQAYDEAARNYYALYGLARNDEASAEAALGGLARLLLSAPEQPIRFGSGNLSFYRDVATMDPHPGFLNGVLSLLLNETDPPNQHAIEGQRASAYFRRAKAAELVALFESRFPNSAERAELRERVIETYAIYGDNEGVLRSGGRFLTDFRNALNRTGVALRMADAYARTNRTAQEFAQYDSVLEELGRRAGGVPIGELAPLLGPGQQERPGALGRSPEYARVLDRYVARLVSLKRTRDALTLYRREIDRNSNDPGLYDRLAAFLEQNQMGAETEQIYQRAMAQFPDPSWRHKLARWYLRQRRAADLSRLTQEVIRVFSGSDLESYFRELSPAQPLGPGLYLQMNLAAHQRFPHQLSFVNNLLMAYTTRGTADDAAYEAVLRQNWYYADTLRLRFFERLSRLGRLNTELSVVRTSNPAANASRWQDAVDQSPAAVRLLAEGEVWRGHFELAAPIMQALEASYPGELQIGRRTAAVFRSLGAADAAIGVDNNLAQADPRSTLAITTLGEIEADRSRFDRARAAWDRIPEIDPAKPAGYLEAATVFWDYYRFDDARRWIDTGRTRLAQPALFAYQAGVIHENQRDYAAAVREYARGAMEQSGSASERRLLLLARRAAYRRDIDQLTDNLASTRNPQAGAFNLRVALLKNQNRRDDLERFLESVVARADAADTLVTTENTARIEGFPRIEQTALERRIQLSTDPVERMSLRLALARFQEGHGQGVEGGQTIDALYRENPAILGVVRATVDYHWRNKNTRRAVDVLEDAAGRAQSYYRMEFTLEASRKAAEAGDYARARTFAERLLAVQPFWPDYVAAMADTYARAHDDQGLRTFYTTKIADLARAPISAGERTEQTAGLRRALIPVLTRTRDFSGAVDQYIEVINRFPEDEFLNREAAQFARANGDPLVRKLRDYYNKASNDSPKDFRWPMVLARLETSFEDYPAAIGALTRASGVRPDRTDLLSSRLNLEERLLRFDEAAATAEKLYELSYRNPQWMEKLAEIRARQGRNTDALAALDKAWITGRAATADNYFSAARKLESWGMITEARRYTEDGLRSVPSGETSREGEALFARLAGRLRDFNAVFGRMRGMDDARAAGSELGSAVSTYYTPDEKLRFATALRGQARRVEIPRAAGLADLEAEWLYAAIMASPTAPEAHPLKEQLIRLQTERTQFAALGQQIENYDRALPPDGRSDELETAASAYRAAGDSASEYRVLQTANSRAALNGAAFERYASLVLAQPARLTAALSQETRDYAAYPLLNYVFQHANEQVAQQAIAARATKEAPLWSRAYTSLGGLHYANNGAAAQTAFTGLLGAMTIGSRIGKPVDRTQQLAGDLWFYYGGRFGEYLGATKQMGAADYLPAMVEATPARSESYFTLGEYFNEAGDATAAAEQYRYALELRTGRADVHDRLAVLAAKAGRTEEAVAEWKLAFQSYVEMLNSGRIPASFWDGMHQTLVHIGDAKLATNLRADADALLRLYVRRNGAFQTEPLLTGAMAMAGDAAAGVAWIVDLSTAAPDPAQFLSPLVYSDWIPEEQRSALWERLVESARARASQSVGQAQADAERGLWSYQIDWVKSLLDRKDNVRARQVLDQLPPEARKQNEDPVVRLEIRVAARTGQLAARLAQFAFPEPLLALRNAANDLREEGDAVSARRALEYVYQHELAIGNLEAANFLGLAEIRLQERDVPGALALLRRMTLVSGEAFTTLDPAAALLERNSRPAEAVEFLTALTKAQPWNTDARRRLAEAQSSGPALSEIARNAAAPYAVRVAAAHGVQRLQAPALTDVDNELVFLSSQAPLGGAQLTNPYAYEARLALVTGAPAQQVTQLQAAIAIDPRPLGPRLRLFRAALAARNDALAGAIGRQFLPQYFQENNPYTPYAANEFFPQVAAADRIAVARGMAEINQRARRWRAAELYFQITQKLDPATSVPGLAVVRAQALLDARNELRRPVVSKNLEQDRLVRPRVTQ